MILFNSILYDGGFSRVEHEVMSADVTGFPRIYLLVYILCVTIYSKLRLYDVYSQNGCDKSYIVIRISTNRPWEKFASILYLNASMWPGAIYNWTVVTEDCLQRKEFSSFVRFTHIRDRFLIPLFHRRATFRGLHYFSAYNSWFSCLFFPSSIVPRALWSLTRKIQFWN